MAAVPKIVQGKRWVFTINNPEIGTPLFTELPEKVEYIVWQLEKGPKEETPHYQGFIRCAVNFRRPRLEKLLGGCAYLALAKETTSRIVSIVQRRVVFKDHGNLRTPF